MVALICCTLMSYGQDNNASDNQAPKPTKYIAVIEEEQKMVFFQGFTFAVDVFNPITYAFSKYGTFEASLRLNLLNTYFPVAEMGYGMYDDTDFNTNVHYKTSAPFVRLGCDINLLKDKFQENRLFFGLRYGFSTFKYDYDGPDMTDPIWGGAAPFSYKGVSSNSHWAELALGVQVKIWRNLHMGWSIRYKRELASTNNDIGKAYYIPGYGTTTSSDCWGATYNLIFDLNWGKNKSHKKRSKVVIGDIQPVDDKTPSDSVSIDSTQVMTEKAVVIP